MPDKKLTDNEIIKALKEYVEFADFEHIEYTSIRIDVLKNALDLINRLQAENERVNIVHRYIDKVVLGNQNFAIADEYLFAYQETLKQLYNNVNAKAEAYKDCIEKVKKELSLIRLGCRELLDNDGVFAIDMARKRVDNLLKELVGDGSGKM